VNRLGFVQVCKSCVGGLVAHDRDLPISKVRSRISRLPHSHTYGFDSNDLDRVALHQEKHFCTAQSGIEEAATLERASLKQSPDVMFASRPWNFDEIGVKGTSSFINNTDVQRRSSV
jgi:predicted transcriptional regulator